PHAYERTAPPIIESEFLQSNNRGAVHFAQGFLLSRHVIQTQKGTIPKNRPFIITPYLALSGERSKNNDACVCKAHRGKA
ncbi:hypothetical protein PL706_07685, partial [Bifidobacterium catenulatum]|uniref:hypothetical protein n=1 Tax=Bifidobacterium TaxID=1678 RepID=UPI00232B1B59